MLLLNLMLFLLLTAVCCDGYKILLVFTFNSKSHTILGEGYVRHLLAAGHDVTYLTPSPMKEQHPRLRQIDVSENKKFHPHDLFNPQKILNKEVNVQDYRRIIGGVNKYLNNTLHIDAIQNLMKDPKEQFDAVVFEWLYSDLGAGMATVFNCPLIWSSSMIPHTFVISLIDEHLNPSYTTHVLSQSSSLSFTERVKRLWQIVKTLYYLWSVENENAEMYKSIYKSALSIRGRPLPEYNEVRYNGSFMLGNGNAITSDTFAFPKNYKDVGGYHIKDTRDPLPENLQKIMDGATNGVIYFSLGSILSTSKMSEKYSTLFFNVLSKVNQTVIWKSDSVLPNLPKNIHMVTWAPQQSILAHPNCILFMTHAGLLSITEAIYFGVPLIGMPFFADQYNNIDKATVKGFAKPLYLTENSEEELKETVAEIVGNPSYRQRAKELSAIYHNSLVPPGKELVYWIEHVIRTRGAPHLKSVAMTLQWYQKLYLDLAAGLIIAVIVLLVLLKSCLKKRTVTHSKND